MTIGYVVLMRKVTPHIQGPMAYIHGVFTDKKWAKHAAAREEGYCLTYRDAKYKAVIVEQEIDVEYSAGVPENAGQA
jgi:hypothetical protein